MVEAEGEIIGYTEITPELGIGRTVLDCFVHQRRRRQGMASKLLAQATKCSGAMGARTVQVSINEAAHAGEALLSRAGFRVEGIGHGRLLNHGGRDKPVESPASESLRPFAETESDPSGGPKGRRMYPALYGA